jgi:hypothetical protein
MTQIFRITHINNLPFIIQNGLHCANSSIQDLDFKPIGFPTLVNYRKDRTVPITPGGVLSDYIPFHFWYRSPMLYVIHKGNDPEVIITPQHDIIYLVSSLETLQSSHCKFVFTDRHAKLEYANFYDNPEDVSRLNWELIKTDDWGRQYGSERMEMKQAECLVQNYVPFKAVIGIAVFNQEVEKIVNQYLLETDIKIPVKVKPNFYF